MILLILSITTLVLLALHVFFNCNARARLIRRIPGPPDAFLVGNMFEFMTSPVKIFYLTRKSNTQWNRIYRFFAFRIGAVNIYTPDDIEAIISTTKHNGKSDVYNFLSPWLKDGLLLSNGEKWQRRRKILTPAFHFNILRKFCITIQENTQRIVAKLDQTAGEKVDIVPILSDFTLNSICETAMGTRLSDEIVDTGKSYKAAVHLLGKFIIERLTRLYLHSDFIFNMFSISKKQKKALETVHSLTKKVIKERKAYVEKNGYDFYESTERFDESLFLNNKKKKTAMLDLLLLAQKDNLIDDVGIQEEVDTFTFEGHDTTAAGLTYCLMLLANNEDIQEKIFQELYEVFGDTDRGATMEELSRLQYLECCIKESMRLYPPVPFISRQLSDTVTLGEYTIPSGTYCHIHIYDLHRRPELYPNPLKYDPDRFLPENCVGRHPFAYIPFSAGPRNCIGQKFAMMEMKSAMSAILRRFRLQAVTRPFQLKISSDLVLRNSEPIYVSFKKRSK